MKELTIKIDELNQLVHNGGKFSFKKDAEEALVQLLEWQEKIDLMISEVKEAIAKAGTSISPDFKGILGSKIKAIFRVYGEKYEYDWEKKDALMDFLTVRTYHKVNSKKVDEYIEKNKKLPDGIKEKEREPIISLTLIKPQLETENK